MLPNGRIAFGGLGEDLAIPPLDVQSAIVVMTRYWSQVVVGDQFGEFACSGALRPGGGVPGVSGGLHCSGVVGGNVFGCVCW